MLKLEGQQTLVVGNRQREITAWADDEVANKFYVMPSSPSIRVSNGKPVFKYMKYRSEVTRQDGAKGGLAVFDVDLAIFADERQELTTALLAQINQGLPAEQQYTSIEFGSIPYTDGAVTLNIQDLSHNLVTQVINSGHPSLFGSNVATFTAELPPQGATFFESGLKDGGGLISVEYDLYFSAMLPSISVDINFNATTFKSYYERQEGSRGWGSTKTQTIREELRKSESLKIDIQFGNTNITEEQKKEIRDWAQGVGEDMIARQLDPDLSQVGNRNKMGDAGFMQTMEYQDSLNAVTSFHHSFSERAAINYNLRPQATLPNITQMVGPDGSNLVSEEELSEYFLEVDLNDDFFKVVNVTITPNTDFDILDLNDLQVKIKYADVPAKEFIFTGNKADPQQFSAYLADDKTREFTWSYQANFKLNADGETPTYQSQEFTSDDTILTVTTNDIGVFLVQGYAKNLDWNLLSRALITLEYEDTENGVEKISHPIELNERNNEFVFSQPIAAKRGQNPYQYKILYTFKDGTEYETDWQEQRAGAFYLNDPFTAQSYNLQAVGVFSDIDAIFLDLTYTEEDGLNFKRNLVFDSQNRTKALTFAGLNPASGKVTYKGSIQKKDGSVEAIEEVTTTDRTIQFGRVRSGVREIEIGTGEMDFENIFKKVKINVRHLSNGKDSFTFRDVDDEEWMFDMTAVNDHNYEWQAEVEFDDALRKKYFGRKIYVPGPNKNEWETNNETEFMLEEHLPSDDELADQMDVRMVKVSKQGIDWSKADELKVEVYVQYGRSTDRIYPLVEGKKERYFEEANGDDDPDGLFLAEKIKDANDNDVTEYQWRAAFHMDGEDTIYYPGPNKNDMATDSLGTLYLADYLSTEFGGALSA